MSPIAYSLTDRHNRTTLVVIVLALSTPLIAAVLNGYFAAWFDNNGRVMAGLLFYWLFTAIISLLLIYKKAEPAGGTVWKTIGLQRIKLRESLIVLIIGFVTLFLVNLAYVILARTIFPTEVRTSPALALPLPLVLLAFITGSITEEILYRGFALERLQRMTGNWWISGGITGALFVFFHVPAYPMAHIVGYIIPATIIITLLYRWKRNLSYCIMFHLVMNSPILLGALVMGLLSSA